MPTTLLRFERNVRTECGIRNCSLVHFSVDLVPFEDFDSGFYAAFDPGD